MELTPRDFRLLRDLALSHVLSRDQVLALGYFDTVTRVNTRLRQLRAEGLVKRLETPFFSQSLYAVGCRAKEVLGDRIGRIVAGRTGSPRFLQHALMVTNTRIALLELGAQSWRFEQQLCCTFSHGGRNLEVRPDGAALMGKDLIAVEVDLGHVALPKFAAKLGAYDAFIAAGECRRAWQVPGFKVLTATTSQQRAKSLSSLLPTGARFSFRCASFEDLGLTLIGGWS